MYRNHQHNAISVRKSNIFLLLLTIALALLISFSFMPIKVLAASTSNGSNLSDWDYTDNGDGTITLEKYKGTSDDVVIPGKLDGKQVVIECQMGGLQGTKQDFNLNDCRSLTFKKVDNTKVQWGNDSRSGAKPTDDMNQAFHYLKELEKIDLSGLEYSNVTDMGMMFNHCDKLTTVTGLDTSNVKIFSSMFAHIKSEKLNINKLDLSNAEMIDAMFYQCENLKDIDVSSWDTSNVRYARMLFDGCKSLTSLDISNLDFSHEQPGLGRPAAHYKEMFADCDSLQLINISIPDGKFVPEGAFDLFRTHSYAFDNTIQPLPTVIITQNKAVKSYSKDGGKTIVSEDWGAGRTAYTATVKMDANGGAFAEKSAGTEKEVTLGGNIFYDTMKAYEDEFTVTKDELTSFSADPEKEGYTFTGWYLDKDCKVPFTTQKLTLDTKKTNVTVYAGYDVKKADPKPDKPEGDKGNGSDKPAQKMVNAVQTGDFSSPYFWAAIVLVAIIGAAVTVIVRRKSVRTN